MEIYLHIETEFECVFLINGGFFEHAEIRTMPSEIVYVTVLPLDASLQSYTVKLLGHRPLSSNHLCLSYKLSDEHYYLRLLERHNIIYTTKKQQSPAVSNNIYNLFKLVKQNNFPMARSLLTESLSATIDNNSLQGFFEGFVDIVENKNYITAPSGSYFLISEDGNGALFVFEQKNALIDNIYEL